MKRETYRTVVVDPPWPMPAHGLRTPTGRFGPYRTASGRIEHHEWWERSRKTALPYKTMTLAQIGALAIPADKHAHLYLWTTNRFLEQSYNIARGWGFKPTQVLTWCKPPMGKGYGGDYCTTTEFILFCRRGTLKAMARADSTWWNWSRPYENGHIAHSAKPDAFQDLVMTISPGPYLEMFARRQRLGWHSWGNECLNHVTL